MLLQTFTYFPTFVTNETLNINGYFSGLEFPHNSFVVFHPLTFVAAVVLAVCWYILWTCSFIYITYF